MCGMALSHLLRVHKVDSFGDTPLMRADIERAVRGIAFSSRISYEHQRVHDE